MRSTFLPLKIPKSSLKKKISLIQNQENVNRYNYKRNSLPLIPLLTIKTAKIYHPKPKIPGKHMRRNSIDSHSTLNPLKNKISLFQLQLSPIEPKLIEKAQLTKKTLERLLNVLTKP